MDADILLKIIDILPKISSAINILFYVFSAWLFGRITFNFVRKDVNFIFRVAIIFVLGFIVIVSGSTISSVVRIDMFESGMLGLVNASMLIFSLISSLIIGAALYLLTSDLRPKSAGYLRKRVSLLEDLLRKSGVVGINANEVKEMVKNRFKCDVNRIERQNDVYVVMCKKGKQEFNTYVDVYDGAIVGTKCNTLVSFFLLNKKKIVGASIVIFFVIITLFNFKNLPRFDLIEGVANMVGIPKEQLSMFYEKDMAEGCVSITKLMIKYSTKINEMDLYENKRVQEEIESILDEKVIAMYKVEYNGNDYIISVSVPKNISSEQLGSKNILKISKVCSIYKNKLCDCMKTPV